MSKVEMMCATCEEKVRDNIFKQLNMVSKIIVKNAVKREKGYLYYIDEKGNLCEHPHGKVDKLRELVREKIRKIENERKK